MTGRVFERKKRQMPCTISFDGNHHGGMILDVSPTGLYIQSSAKMKPGDHLTIQMMIPGIEGRVVLEVEVVRKVIVPNRLLKVARGGVGVRILNAPEPYYRFMESLGITSDAGGKTPRRLGAAVAPRKRAAPASDDSRAADASPPSSDSPSVSEIPTGDDAREESAQCEIPPPTPRFRVRVKKGPRSRAIEVSAEDESAASLSALAELGEGWAVLGVDRIADG